MRQLLAFTRQLVEQLSDSPSADEPRVPSIPSAIPAACVESDGGISKADIVSETGLTPEEYLLQFVAVHGGRVEQQRIVALTGWSESAVSHALAGMEKHGLVARVRVGRRNVVCLPEATPDVEKIGPEEVDVERESAA